MDGYEWSFGYLWRWMNCLERLAIIVLAFMLINIVVIFTRVYYRYRLARRTEVIDTASGVSKRGRRSLVADLSLKVASLKSMASVAPFLGLGGTCFGILSTFRGYDGPRYGLIIMLATGVAAALISTAAGLLVVIPATWSYNYLRTRIDGLEYEIRNVVEQGGRQFQVAQKLPLIDQFTTVTFPLIAALTLAVIVAAFMSFSSFHTPRGFGVELVSDRCGHVSEVRPIVLRITDGGSLLLNQEHEQWNSLAGRLAEIYSMRVHHVLYLSAGDGVPFQTVADAIDIAINAPVTGKSRPVRISVRLLTPIAMKAHCPEP